MNAWGTAVVVDPNLLESLRFEVTDLKRLRRRLSVWAYALATVIAVGFAVGLPVLWRLTVRATQLTQDNAVLREQFAQATAALGTIADSHKRILDATREAPSVGTKS